MESKPSGLILAGGPERPLPLAKSGDDLRKLGLGTAVIFWHGDDAALGTLVGGIPKGYITRPLYKHWLRGVDSPGFFSFGPYQRLGGVGNFKVWFFIEVISRGGANEVVLEADVVDHDNNGSVLASGSFQVHQFPSQTDGFTIYSQELSIPHPDHRIESRIFAKGGASIKLWGIRWEIDTL